MTRLLSIDPGKNTGISLGFYNETTPYQLVERYQVHGGVAGFKRWWTHERPVYDELVVEKFVLARNNFQADLTPVHIEGALCMALTDAEWRAVTWQMRTHKALLTGYPPEAKTKAQRQRVRFNFLAEFGLHAKGTDNDDSNDAITHSLVYLKQRKHMPTLRTFWPPRPVAA